MLEGALERSVALAAAMDARGYGRTAQVPPAVRRTTTALTLGGLLGVCAGTYGLLAAEGACLRPAGAARRAGRRARGALARRAPLACAPATGRTAGARGPGWSPGPASAVAAAADPAPPPVDPAALHPGVVPLVAPTLPLWPAAAVLIGLLPAFVAPAPEAAADSRKEPA